MKKKSLNILMSLFLTLLIALSFSVNASNAAVENFSGYEINTNGNASVQIGVLQLTPNLLTQRGSAFINHSYILTSSSSFSSAFSFRITGGSGGADGLVFMLQNDAAGLSALGGFGGFLGYSPISPSIAVEFDTYEISGEHIGININGSVSSVLTSNSIPDLNSGDPVYAWVDYDGTADLLEVFVSDSSTKPASPQLSYTVDISVILGPTFYAGFSASTGGASNAHLIDSWSFELFNELCEWIPETAWAAGPRYVSKGSWSTYTSYADVEKTVTLYAGQGMVAGSVHFSDKVGGAVNTTITLNEGWRFSDVEDNVKIQGYMTAPNRKPNPGKFSLKEDADTSPYMIIINDYNYYGVHVNVEWEDCSVPGM